MISSKDELQFYIMADHMMNRGKFRKSLIERAIGIFRPDYIMKYLIALRKAEYYSYRGVLRFYYKLKLNKLGIKLGFSIAQNVFGYGLVIPHYGTIVVGSGNQIGNYCVLHTSICITAGHKRIGHAFYCSTGAKILNDILIGDNVTVGANAVVNKSVENNQLVVGIPAAIKHIEPAWYTGEYARRVKECEELRNKMRIIDFRRKD